MTIPVVPRPSRPELLTVSETAELLRVSEESVRRKVRCGDLPAYHLGAKGSPIRIPRAGLVAWLRESGEQRP
jgi:excisionase family DNA binding protein